LVGTFAKNIHSVRDPGIERGPPYCSRGSPTAFSKKETDVGPKPFHRPLLISLSFSSPVFSSTKVVTEEFGFGLKLRRRKKERHE
jgi:hypothetical protein